MASSAYSDNSILFLLQKVLLFSINVSRIVVLIILISSFGLSLTAGATANSDKYEYIGTKMHDGKAPFEVRLCQSQSLCSNVPIAPNIRPPRPLLIAFPASDVGHESSYPVLLFKHGMAISICDYSQLMRYIASFGYIVVAAQESLRSQMNLLDATEEIDATAKVLNWLPTNLAILLATQVAMASTTVAVPNLDKLFLAGHSRGGKIIYGVALGLGKVQVSSNFSGLIALDPVDAASSWIPLKPLITTLPDCELNFPALIEGTGLGGACAPSPFNHPAFFNNTRAPIVYHLIPTQYGHMDLLDDGASALMGWVCGGNSSRAGMRNFTGGLIVAFLESALYGTTQPMQGILANWQTAIVKLEKPECSSNGTTMACPGMEPHTSPAATDVASTIDHGEL